MKTRPEIENFAREIAPEITEIRHAVENHGFEEINIRVQWGMPGQVVAVTNEKNDLIAEYFFAADGYNVWFHGAQMVAKEKAAYGAA